MKNLKLLWINLSSIFDRFVHKFLEIVVSSYRTIGTTYLGGSCRFQPSCSEYAVECLHTHNGFYSFWLITKRILKCRPGGPFGFDPVPPKLKKNSSGENNVHRK